MGVARMGVDNEYVFFSKSICINRIFSSLVCPSSASEKRLEQQHSNKKTRGNYRDVALEEVLIILL